MFYYIRHHQYDLCGSGELAAYTGLFGKGKTLSAVHKVVTSYHQYNGKKVWCPRRKKLVTQRVKVISNVSLSIPYEDFISLEQIVLAAERNREYDDEHNTLTVTLVLGDEFSVQMNSRNFKTNIDPLFLNTILTCRHYYISLYYTAQRFGHVDALLRQVTSYVVDCDKLWRFQRLNYFEAWDLENAANTQPVVVLVGSLLPDKVRMAVINLKPLPAENRLVKVLPKKGYKNPVSCLLESTSSHRQSIEICTGKHGIQPIFIGLHHPVDCLKKQLVQAVLLQQMPEFT